MKVWRVAHNTLQYQGLPSGPYILDGLSDEASWAVDDMRCAHSDSSHPAPSWDDTLGYIRSWERCGFDSEESLYSWFEGFAGMLDSQGFEIWVYEVPEDKVRVGKFGQALFSQDSAVLKDSHDFKKELVS